MKITYLGNERFPWCTEVHIADSLRMLGHEVLFLQEDENTVEQVVRDASSCDLFLWTRTAGFLKGDGNWMLEQLKAAGVTTASYHLDLYVGLQRESGLNDDPFWRTDFVFTPDGDPHSEEVFAAKGINHHYLPPAVYAPECVDGVFDARFNKDVGFVGSVENYHQEWTHRPALVTALDLNYGSRFDRWPRLGPAVRGHNLNNLCSTVQVLVGDSLCLGFDHERYWSDRIYELIGRGGFLIHPIVKGIEEQFTDGENIVLYEFGDFAGLIEKIDYYLAHPDEREDIRVAGQELIKEKHTYTNRLERALSITGGAS